MAQQNSKKKTKNQIQWKSSPYKRTKEEAAVFTVLLLSAFLYGGFYEFSGAMLAAVLGILLIVCRVKYSFQIKGKKQLAVLLSVFLWFGITCFYAIDRAMAFVGGLLAICFSCSFRMKPDKKQQAISHTSAALWYWPGFWHCHFRL